MALLTAGFLLLARLLKLGFLADFLSRTVLIGFLTGVGFQVGIAVLSDMLKLEVHGSNPVRQLVQFVRQLPQANFPLFACRRESWHWCCSLTVSCRGSLGRSSPLWGRWRPVQRFISQGTESRWWGQSQAGRLIFPSRR